MTLPPSSILLITGIMAAGKSTVAQRAAERLPKSVHLRGDIFRRMIVNGQAAIELDLSEEAIQQLDLRYQLAATSANLYCEAGFTVVYQDIILGQSLTDVVNLLKHHPLHVVVCAQRRRWWRSARRDAAKWAMAADGHPTTWTTRSA
jgi:cytidylate kinase